MMSEADKGASPPDTAEVETTLRMAQAKVIPSTAVRDQDTSPLGRTIKGRFVLESQLGDGGMGVVYKALDLRRQEKDDPNTYVALKLIGGAIQSHPEAPLALQREASRALRLAHHNIVHMYDFDRDGDLSFLTMELLSGKSFDALLREHRSGMAFGQASPLIQQLCSGLAYAHAQGIIHSDLKPSNVFLTNEGVVKILDFGIATPLRGLNDSRPETSFNPRRMGALSPSHACVEMWFGLDADPRDDIYSLACIMYQMYSGHHPFHGMDAPKAMDTGKTVAPIATLTRQQNQALRMALNFRREGRTANVQQLVKDFGFDSGGASRIQWVPVSAAAAIGIAMIAAVGMRYVGLTTDAATETVAAQTETAVSAGASGRKSESAATTGAAQDAAAATPGQTASDAAAVAGSQAQPFETRCQGSPGPALLSRLVDQGLREQTNFTLGTDADKKQAQSSILRIVTCIRELQALGFTDEGSRALVRDAEATLAPALSVP